MHSVLNPTTAPASILIVDGYGHSREGLTASLAAAGLSIETAADYPEAIRKAKDTRVTVAIIDVDLPATGGTDLTGWDLARVVRALHPASALILVTSDWRPELAAEAARLPGCRVIEKPISPAEVRTMLLGGPVAFTSTPDVS